jgi:hypothetical protein
MKDNEKFDNRDKVDEAKDEKCNHSAKGKKCPVHGLKECGGGMYEAKKTMSQAGKGKDDLAKKKASDKVKEAIARAKDVLEGKGKKKDKMDMEGNAFGKAVADAKKDGVQKGEKVNVGGKDIPLKESVELNRLKVLTQRLNG